MTSSRNEKEGVVDPGRLGLAVQALTPDIAGQLGYDKDTEGVVIARVRPGSEAARRGLRRGLLITGINRISVESISDYEDAIAEIGSGEAFTLRVQTPDDKRLIAMRMPAAE